LGENVAMGWADPAAVLWKGWYESDGHHKNMLGKSWNVAGVGHVQNTWTQMFGSTNDHPALKT
jgi:uncharacterized protein YkwD